MLCCHIAAWVDTLPPGRGRYFATGSFTLAVALPWWSRSSSFFDDGVSFLQAQFFCNLVRVVGLGVSSLPFLLLPVVVVVVAAFVAARCVLVVLFFSVSFSLVLCVLVLAKFCLAAPRFVCKLLSS